MTCHGWAFWTICIWVVLGNMYLGCFGQYVFGLLWAICIWVALGNIYLGCFGQYIFGLFWAICLWVVLGITYLGRFGNYVFWLFWELCILVVLVEIIITHILKTFFIEEECLYFLSFVSKS